MALKDKLPKMFHDCCGAQTFSVLIYWDPVRDWNCERCKNVNRSSDVGAQCFRRMLKRSTVNVDFHRDGWERSWRDAREAEKWLDENKHEPQSLSE